MHWIALAKERPALTGMGQTDVLLVVYDHPEHGRVRTIAFYDAAGTGTGWRQAGTFTELPEPTHWLPLPPLP